MATEAAHRSRPPALLALGQVRYQLMLLLRSPLGFLSIVFPLLLLVCLKVITPSHPVDGLPYAQWVTPALCAFCLLNACYVTVITSMVLAREEGTLKRLRGTPLPAWAYLAGRSGSAFVTSVIACSVIIATGMAFFHVSIVWHAFGYFIGATLLGIACFFLIGAAVTTVVPKTETALPIAFGTMLPLAFISDVFFSVSHRPRGCTTWRRPSRSPRSPRQWRIPSTRPPSPGQCRCPGCWWYSAGARPRSWSSHWHSAGSQAPPRPPAAWAVRPATPASRGIGRDFSRLQPVRAGRESDRGREGVMLR
jgi:uncharacterized membrane protein YdcZ (DUF606 family)